MQKVINTAPKLDEHVHSVTVPRTSSGHFPDLPSSSGELISKNIRIGKKRTSIRLEPEMWAALDLIIKKEKIITANLFDHIAQAKRKNSTFTATLRTWILSYFVKKSGFSS